MMRVCSLFVACVLLVGSQGAVQDQPGSPPPSKNLLTDASFEGAPPAGLPSGWSYWSAADGSKYRAEVVAGGRTGNKCLKMEGKGVRGVVFANGVKIERDKRYVLRGWAKFEGGKDARALIMFHYFHNGKWLGLPDVIGVTSKHKDWRLLAKTDRADEVPDASTIWISCTLEGKGTAWFDDLELVAYDRKNLPEDFETRFGPSNVSAEFSVLARRIGTWDTQTTIKPGVRITDGLKSTGVETVEWVLGKKLIQSKHKQQPWTVEALSLLAYDAQFDAFRSWYFDSTGNLPRGELTGQWDEEARTLTFKGTEPEEVTVTTVLRFVSPDRTELQGVWRDKTGGIVMEMEQTATRRK